LGPAPSLDELVKGPIAAGILRALMRDMARQATEQGMNIPAWTLPVYQALQDASGMDLDRAAVRSVLGPRPDTLKSANWVGVMEAATRAGCSTRHARRLAASGRVIARRLDRHQWLIDLESLTNVLRKMT